MAIGGVSGPTLGNVKAKMTLDIADFVRDSARVQNIGKKMGRSFDSVNTALGRTQRNLRAVGGTVRELRGEITALGVAAAGVTFFGLREAKNIRNYTVAFRTLLGSQEEAVKTMKILTETANEFGLELNSTLQLGRSLLPMLENNTDELDEWVKRAAMLRSVFPIAQKGAETRAISEFLAGQTISMQRLFNIAPGIIQEAQAATDDLGEQLDIILVKMGATEDGAREMADSFVSVRNEIGLMLAVGFKPMFDVLQKNLVGVREWMQALRESHPEILNFTAGIIGITAVVAPAILVVERLTKAIIALRAVAGAKWLAQLAVAAGGSAAGTVAGVASAGVLAGLGASVPIVRGLGAAGAFGETDVSDFGFMDAAEALMSIPGLIGDALIDLSPENSAIRQNRAERQLGRSSQVTQADLDMAASIAAGTGSLFGPKPVTMGGAGGLTIGDEAQEAISAWAEAVADIEESAAQDRLQATETFERQRTNSIRQFEKTIAREAEDFARQRARAEASHIRAVQDVREAATRRESTLTEDHAERVEDINENHAEKLEDIEKNSARQRLDLQESHRDTILKAAGRLDAAAIAQENRRFQTQLRKIDRDEKDKTKDANKSNAERLKDENKGFEERREAARQADADRIQDMQEAFDRQKAQEDEDRALRLGRMKQDHADQLTAQDTAHALRIEQIAQHADDEREQLDKEFEKALAEEGIATKAFITGQELRAAAALRIFKDWWDDLNGVMQDTGTSGGAGGGAGTVGGDPSTVQQFARGGAVAGTGRALVHAGEFVLNSNVTDSLRAMMGNFSQPELVNAVAGGNSVSLTVAPGAIQINGADSPGDIADQVEAALLNAVRGLA